MHQPLTIQFAAEAAVKSRTFGEVARAFVAEWRTCERPGDLVKQCDDLSLAQVLWGILGRKVYSWLDAPLLVFAGSSPREVIADAAGRERLKALLLESRLLAEALEPHRTLPRSTRTGIIQLFRVDPLIRTRAWSEEIQKALSRAELQVDFGAMLRASDSRFAFAAYTENAPDPRRTLRMSMPDISRRALPAGHGLVINPNKAIPDWVVTAGEMTLLAETGSMAADDNGGAFEGSDVLDAEIVRRARAPQPRILRDEGAAALNTFLTKSIGIAVPRIGELPSDEHGSAVTLIVNVSQERFGDDVSDTLEAIKWFVRSDCRIAGVTDEATAERYLTKLGDLMRIRRGLPGASFVGA